MKMRKKTNKMLRSLLRQLMAAFLILVLAAAPIAALPVHAAAQAPEEVLNNEATDAVLSVAINCSGTEVGLLEITEDAFRFARLPYMNDFNRVRLQVIDSAGNAVVVEYRDI